jgi:flagellar biosynthesis protein FlhF
VAALLRACRPDEVHLVLPASSAPGVQARLAASFRPLGIDRLVLTHVDEVLGLGVVLSTIEKLQWRLSYLCTGQHVPADICVACADRLAEVVFPPGADSVRRRQPRVGRKPLAEAWPAHVGKPAAG